jgi:hypothetical protein
MDVLKLERVNDRSPIMKATMPKEILTEVREWVKECRKVKDHPLAELRSHENVGYLSMDGQKHNSYQCSIPPRMVEESYWLGWVLRLTAKYYGAGKTHRDFKLRKWDGHFDGYDIWTNFAYKGDDNPEHNHAGLLSGVMYIQNDGQPTIFPKYNTTTDAKVGNMYIWPSQEAFHYVEEKKTRKERVTVAFNIVEKE